MKKIINFPRAFSTLNINNIISRSKKIYFISNLFHISAECVYHSIKKINNSAKYLR